MLSYAVITPARDEEENLPRLASALAAQTRLPQEWIIVDDGSTDRTPAIVAALASTHAWVSASTVSDGAAPDRPRAAHGLTVGLEALTGEPDVVVKLDADISVGSDYFKRLLDAFEADPALGIASGTCYELEDSRWVSRNVTGSSVWGAARAYRRACLDDVLPLEPRTGWDGLDEIRANARGWKTRTIDGLAFRHHRAEGARDRSRLARRATQGSAAWYMGYSPLYLTLRALHHARHDAASLAMVWGYAGSAIRREPRDADADARAYLRRQQRIRNLWARRREATRPPETL